MSRYGFNAIESNLRVNSKSQILKYNTEKLHELQPVVSEFSEQFSKLYSGPRKLSIDGTVILFKRGSNIKPHNTQTGLLNAARSRDVSYVLLCLKGSVWLLRQSESVAWRRGCVGVRGQYRILDFDNFFTSLPHLDRLKMGWGSTCLLNGTNEWEKCSTELSTKQGN
jgi:hypothetical protein